MEGFIDERWRLIFSFNGLDDFDALWRLQIEWFEEPNYRRGGWSGVARCELSLPEGGTTAIFLKRQENHRTRSLQHPLNGEPTFLREFKRIMTCRRYAIPSLEPVYFAMRGRGRNQRAILATVELTGFASLAELERRWAYEGLPPRAVRLRLFHAIAALLRRMHEHGICHGCFYPKHVFIRMIPEADVTARVIDLEKSRRLPLRAMCAFRDLYCLNHHSSPAWSRTDRLRLFLIYLGLPRLNARGKCLWRRIAARSARKRLECGIRESIEDQGSPALP
ncbi:MAG: lipopolysaccharide kinase InaA family protein [Candidatus Accumulibacter sp.]|nr:lipopolysaccharide kinase InaA family protein [Accumulibacter sp.]